MVMFKDMLLQQECPTVMVPKYSPLGNIVNGHRYLMAEDGLWIEARPAWGHIRLPLWKSPRTLPYGVVAEFIALEGGAMPRELLLNCVVMAKKAAENFLEWGGWIVWNKQSGYSYLCFSKSSASFSSLRFSYPELPEGTHLVMDIHSHPFDMPAFSKVDDHDDAGGIRFSGVISFDREKKPNLKVRLCVEGHFFEKEEFYEEALSSE